MKKILYAIFFVLFSGLTFLAGYRTGSRSTSWQPVDTIRRIDTLHLPTPVVEREILVPVPAEVDTAAILEAYFAQRIYQDTLIDTPSQQVILRDTVFQNLLWGRTVVSQLKIPTYSSTVSIGTVAGYRNISLMAGYRYKRMEFLAGYDFYHRAPMVGVKYDMFRW